MSFPQNSFRVKEMHVIPVHVCVRACVSQFSKLYMYFTVQFLPDDDDDDDKQICSDLCKACWSTSQEFCDEQFGNSAVRADE